MLPLILGAAVFCLRFLAAPAFSNDHFVHLSRAHAMLAGDLPLRDYTEEGVPLTVLLSATAQRLLGEGIFAELLLVLTSLDNDPHTGWPCFRELAGPLPTNTAR